jgi:hypothetical protein
MNHPSVLRSNIVGKHALHNLYHGPKATCEYHGLFVGVECGLVCCKLALSFEKRLGCRVELISLTVVEDKLVTKLDRTEWRHKSSLFEYNLAERHF